MNAAQTLADIASIVGQPNLIDYDFTESKLMRSIESHKHRIYTIEKASGPSRRTQFLREEVARLEIELEIEMGDYR